MYLTGKNKENFEKWFTSDARFFAISCIAPRSNYDDAVLAAFEQLPFQMKLGVYLGYFDSIGVKIATPTNGKEFFYHIEINYENNQFESLTNDQYRTTVIEVYKHAFKKADEIINNFLK